jgi:hypothetical protein
MSMRDIMKWWLRRYAFLCLVLVVAWVPLILVLLFFIAPMGMYLSFGEWVVDTPDKLFSYWLTPVVIGLIIATGMVAYEWYLNTFGHPVKKAIYAMLFCALVAVFVFAILIPWGRDMVPHLVTWWQGL